MITRKSKKILSALVAGFLFCYSGNHVLANEDLSVNPTVEQQEGRTVTGLVTDAQGEPLIGVSVAVQGRGTGAVTDQNGHYSVQVQGDNQVLQFSYIGYRVFTVTANRNLINVTMEEDINALSEVVVTALGIKKERKALPYSVQDLNSDELLKNKTANPLNSLQGKVAGVNITQSSGAAGAGAQIILRGGTSLERDNQPLFVVDGVIYDNSTSVVGNSAFDGMTGIATSNSNRIMDVSTEDIENISILKGPAASALYGSRAANGVVMITTKKGQEGVVSVEFGTKISSVWANRLPEQQSTYGRGILGTDGQPDAASLTYSSWGEKIGNKPIYNNIQDFFQTGSVWDNTLSISTGNKNGSTYVSLSRFDQTGIIPNTGYDKTTFRINSEQKYGRLTVGAGIAYSQANTQKTLTSSGLWGSGGNGTMSAVYRWARNDDMKHYEYIKDKDIKNI